MKKITILLAAISFCYCISNQAKAQNAMNGMSNHIMLNQASFQWGGAPPVLPMGARITVLQGDPSQSEPFVVRLEFPAGYKIPAHWHPTTENVTVMSGTLYMGMGEKLDESTATAINTGGFASMPAKSAHFAFTKDGCVVQIHAMGPFEINYINPADDPSKK